MIKRYDLNINIVSLHDVYKHIYINIYLRVLYEYVIYIYI